MKRKILVLLVLIPMLFILCGCSDEKVKTSDNKDNVKTEESDELAIDGTGEVNFKEFVESFKIANKTWTEVSIDEAKAFYQVNENKETSTITLPNGDEIWGSYSGKGVTATIEKDGEEVTVYNESVKVKELNGSNLWLTSEDIVLDGERPKDLKVDHMHFDMVCKTPDMTEENKQAVIEKSKLFSTFISENKCNSLESIIKALGMEETDKTLFKAIEEGLEYSAEYKSDYGNLDMSYYTDGESKTLTFKFDDESEIEEIGINGLDSEYGEIQVYIYKNLDK